MKYAYASDVGNYREENEDTVAVFKVDDIFKPCFIRVDEPNRWVDE